MFKIINKRISFPEDVSLFKFNNENTKKYMKSVKIEMLLPLENYFLPYYNPLMYN